MDGRRPQLVFQDPKSFLTPWVPIGEQIVEGLRSAKVAKVPRDKRLAELMDFVDLERSLADALPSELSVGQCQRAAIARALAVSPRLLLCDEPISALDTSLAASMLNLLGRIRRIYGTAIVIATHDLAAARIAADRVYRIHDGKLLELADMSTSSRNDRCDPSAGTPDYAEAVRTKTDGHSEASSNGWSFRRIDIPGMIGLFGLLLITATAAFPQLFMPLRPATAGGSGLADPPSMTHPFGTDEIGRDLFSRVILGIRFTWLPGMAIIGASFVVGTAIGLVSGFVGGWLDAVFRRVNDVFLTVPSMLFAIAFAAFARPRCREFSGRDRSLLVALVRLDRTR